MLIYAIDKDYDALKAYEENLSSMAEVHCFTTMPRLLEAIKTNTPDLIIACADDVNIDTFTASIRTIGHPIKILFVSASGYLAQAALNAGAAGYLIKPVSAEKLQSQVNNLRPKAAVKNIVNSLLKK